MNLPDLSKVEIPKRESGIIAGILIITQIPDFNKACVAAALLAIYVVAQTITDIRGKEMSRKE